MNTTLIHKTSGRTIVLICLVLLAQTPLVRAADDITGDWEITMEYGGRQTFAALSISENADGTLAAKWGSDELSNVKFQDGQLTFTRTVRFGDNEFSMNYVGTLKDGKFEGLLSSDRGEFPANAARKKPKLPVLGHWDVSFNVGDREITGKLSISQQPDGTLEGKWTSERGNTVISNVKFQDGKLTYHRKSTFGERTYESDFEGTIKGHELTGAFKAQRGEMPATGKRIGAALVGKWELTSTSDRGTFTYGVTIYGDMTGRSEFFGSELPIDDFKLEGDQVTYTLEWAWGDRTFTMNFKGTLDGKNLTGQFTSEWGTSEVSAKKIEAASPFVGKWELTTTSERGTRTRALTINEDMTGTYQMRDREVPVKDLKIEGDQISFKVEMSFGDRQFTMDFKGKLAGEALEGEFTTSRGSRKATGKKMD
jgi:hypothetical protein